jgi:cytochrome P450
MTETYVRLDKALVRDPKPLYERLRATAPVQPILMPDGVPGWLVTGYPEARALLEDRRLSKNVRRALELFPDHMGAGFGNVFDLNMLNTDPPDHTRLRNLVNKAFTSRSVARLQPRIEQITDELLDAMAAKGEVDLIEAFAFPLPIAVICELLGVPAEDHDRMHTWSNIFTGNEAPDLVGRAVHEMIDYLRSLATSKRAEPGDDMLSSLAVLSDEDGRLSDDELLAMAFLLVVAGHETVLSLLANSVLALLRNPDQLASLRSDPDLLPGAIEEFLRYESPTHIATLRFTVEPVLVGDTEIPAHQFVMISLLAANNDGARFPDPHRLDVTRSAGGHLAFGHGIHYCVGAPLARLEARIALGRLLARFDDISLAVSPEDIQWRDSTLMHSPRTLRVRVRPVGRRDPSQLI